MEKDNLLEVFELHGMHADDELHSDIQWLGMEYFRAQMVNALSRSDDTYKDMELPILYIGDFKYRSICESLWNY